MDSVLEALRASLKPGSAYLLAVSGGIDSIVLLHACVALRADFSLRLVVAHVDHGLREESKDEAEGVNRCAALNQLPIFIHRPELPPPTRNIEAWGRSVRYSFFCEVLEREKLDAVITAHHRDDVAETVLMRFLANREPSSIHAFDEKRQLLRPFLRVSRATISAYASEHQLPFFQDSSNTDIKYLRNQYRQVIIPFLQEQLHCEISPILADRAESLEDDAAALEQAAREGIHRLASMEPGSKVWLRSLRSQLKHYPRAIAWRVVERLLADRYGDYFGRRTSLRVLDFLLGAQVAIEIPGGRRLARRQGGLLFLSGRMAVDLGSEDR